MAYEHKWRKQTLHSMLRPWRSPMSHFCSSGNGGSIELHESHESLFVSAPCLSMFVRFFFPYALCTHSALWLQFFSQKKNTMTGKAPSLLWITAKVGHLRLPANSSNMDTCDVFTKVCKTSHCTAHCLPISRWPIGRMKSYVSVCNSCNNADHILSFVFVLPLAAPHKFSVHRICSDSWWHLHRDAGAMHNYCISLGFVNLWTAEVWYKTNNIF